jgi:hypothetical protein
MWAIDGWPSACTSAKVCRFGAGYAAERARWLLANGAALRFVFTTARTTPTSCFASGLVSGRWLTARA